MRDAGENVLKTDDAQIDSNGRIVGLFHGGISVADLDRSLAFYRGELGLEVLAQRDATDGYLGRMHGLPFTLVRIAFLAIPNSTAVIELLEYRGVSLQKPAYIPMDPGTGHVCFLVDDLHALFDRLRASGHNSRSDAPIEITAGPNRGSWAAYFEDPDGYPVEFIERAGP
jgi:catechol 2,3-dioxygenase-like lactoylglutathione lyase family enzyme